MTNSNSRFNQVALSEEETIITMKEKLVPFSTVKLTDLVAEIQNNQTNGSLSIPALRKSISSLQIDLDIFTVPDDHFHKLLKLLKNQKRLYDARLITIFGLLLCMGTPKEKSKVLFELFDEKQIHCLTKPEIEAMITELIDVSANKIPKIAVDDSETPENFTLTEMQVNAYSEKLMRNKERYTQRVLMCLLGDENRISKLDFIKKISENPLLETLVWSYQLRLDLND